MASVGMALRALTALTLCVCGLQVTHAFAVQLQVLPACAAAASRRQREARLAVASCGRIKAIDSATKKVRAAHGNPAAHSTCIVVN